MKKFVVLGLAFLGFATSGFAGGQWSQPAVSEVQFESVCPNCRCQCEPIVAGDFAIYLCDKKCLWGGFWLEDCEQVASAPLQMLKVSLDKVLTFVNPTGVSLDLSLLTAEQKQSLMSRINAMYQEVARIESAKGYSEEEIHSKHPQLKVLIGSVG